MFTWSNKCNTRALGGGRLGWSGLLEVALLLPTWSSGRSHFPLYSVAVIARSILVLLIFPKSAEPLPISWGVTRALDTTKHIYILIEDMVGLTSVLYLSNLVQ